MKRFSKSTEQQMRNEFLEEYTDRRLKNMFKKISSNKNELIYFYVTKYRLFVNESDVQKEMRKRKLNELNKV